MSNSVHHLNPTKNLPDIFLTTQKSKAFKIIKTQNKTIWFYTTGVNIKRKKLIALKKNVRIHILGFFALSNESSYDI